ncbi:GDSL esterase/lipase At1g71691-like [Pyrus x bretschneideri]|uniref:GDSL esterase/lipase At1g71691-like n=1 Tax=Pyrus x bretschneideri TaxID=225117 RepID=UPI00202DC9B2|nr:GDSL esterase/lipase At1g71691-like [Pyrus x bretschneideri]
MSPWLSTPMPRLQFAVRNCPHFTHQNPILFLSLSKRPTTMAIKLLVALLYILLSTTAAQPCYPLYSQELINSMGPTFSPFSSSSSSSFPPTPTASIESNPTPFVPALFVIGDSSVDCGTNNFLGTFAHADHLPYGRDFDTHQPIGRFCNGIIPVDYLGLTCFLQLASSAVHRHLSLVYNKFGGASYNRSRLKFDALHFDWNQRLHTLLFAQCVQRTKSVLSLGFQSVSNIHIENLYNINVMKVVVMRLALIGCAPHYLSQYRVKDGQCIEEINNMVMEFNFVMRYMIEELREELPVTNIIFYNMFEGSMDIIKNFAHYGERFSKLVNSYQLPKNFLAESLYTNDV